MRNVSSYILPLKKNLPKTFTRNQNLKNTMFSRKIKTVSSYYNVALQLSTYCSVTFTSNRNTEDFLDEILYRHNKFVI